MTDREKLVELINHVCEHHIENLLQPGGAEALADHLLANEVTMQRCGDGIERPIKFAGFVKIGIEDIKGTEEYKKLEEYDI